MIITIKLQTPLTTHEFANIYLARANIGQIYGSRYDSHVHSLHYPILLLNSTQLLDSSVQRLAHHYLTKQRLAHLLIHLKTHLVLSLLYYFAHCLSDLSYNSLCATCESANFQQQTGGFDIRYYIAIYWCAVI